VVSDRRGVLLGVDHPRRGADPLGDGLGPLGESVDEAAQTLGVAGRDESAAAAVVVEELREGAAPAGDHRHAVGDRLARHQAEALEPQRRHQEHVEPREDRALLALGEAAVEAHGLPGAGGELAGVGG